MKKSIFIVSGLILFLNSNLLFAQEWRNLKSYQKETGHLNLQDGCWLKKDRKKRSELWNQANLFNLSSENGHQKYKTISQIKNFYLWYDSERQLLGH